MSTECEILIFLNDIYDFVFLLIHSIFCGNLIINFENSVDAVSFFIIDLSAHPHGKVQADLQRPNACFFKGLGI